MAVFFDKCLLSATFVTSGGGASLRLFCNSGNRHVRAAHCQIFPFFLFGIPEILGGIFERRFNVLFAVVVKTNSTTSSSSSGSPHFSLLLSSVHTRVVYSPLPIMQKRALECRPKRVSQRRTCMDRCIPSFPRGRRGYWLPPVSSHLPK